MSRHHDALRSARTLLLIGIGLYLSLLWSLRSPPDTAIITVCWITGVSWLLHVAALWQLNMLQPALRYLDELAADVDAAADRRSAYNEGLVAYASGTAFDPLRPVGWREGWHAAEVTCHNRRCTERLFADELSVVDFTTTERAHYRAALIYAGRNTNDLGDMFHAYDDHHDHDEDGEPAACVRIDGVDYPGVALNSGDFGRVLGKIEAAFNPVSGMPAKLREAEKLGLSFGVLKESGKPPRMTVDFRDGSELARLQRRDDDAFVARVAGSPDAQ